MPSEITDLVVQYFEAINLTINSTKTHCILFYEKQNWQESVQTLIKDMEIINVKSTNFICVI